MTITILLPLLLAVVGLLTYAMATNPKASDAGRITFAVGLFWTVAALAHVRFGV